MCFTESSCRCPWMPTHRHTHSICGWCEVRDSEVNKQTQTTRAFSHTYQQHLGWGSNERDKSREKPCKFDPISLVLLCFFLALDIIYQLTADEPVREAHEIWSTGRGIVFFTGDAGLFGCFQQLKSGNYFQVSFLCFSHGTSCHFRRSPWCWSRTRGVCSSYFYSRE